MKTRPSAAAVAVPDQPGTRRKPIRLAVVLGVAAVMVCFAPTAGASSPAVAAADVIDCHVYAYYPNVLISSARNMSCGAAARDMRRNRKPISRRFTTPGGFSCSQVSGVPVGGQWRCVRGARAYRFEFGD
jgi:hypothetical protein